ncbi:MAG: methyltransferase domain-containing protein [Bacteroidia bacterium]|nr:methyltransferase domain-containing protein [Bacteroidia bacterium]
MKRIISWALRKVPRHLLHRIAPIITKTMSLFMRGNIFEDPITGISYRRMLPYGRINSRPNAMAPDSLSLERHRLQWLYLERKTDFFKKQAKVLHMAPEYCFRIAFKKLDHLEYITADLNSPWADVHCDICDLPFDDDTFDVVLCNHVLEHIEDDQQAMKELFRVLKPGGWAMLQVPINYQNATTYEDSTITDPKEREKHFWQDDHYRLYGRDYAEVLSEIGFESSEINFISELSEEEIKRFGLMPQEKVYIGKKTVAVLS